MKTCGVLFLFVSMVCGAGALPNLKAGQCYSDPDSKVYLSGFANLSVSAAQKIRSEIGEPRFSSLMNTPSTHFYFCKMTCRERSQKLSEIWVLQSDSPSQFSAMNGFLCHGVSIENVQIVGSIYGPQPVIRAFSAFETSFPELHSWLKKTEFRLTPEEFQDKRQILRATLDQVMVAYLNSNSVILKTAGISLWQINSPQVQDSELRLQKKVEELALRNWDIEKDFLNPHFFVENLLRVNGRFLEYRPQP